MLRRPFCGMAAGFILGILTAVSNIVWLLPAAVILFIGVFVLVMRQVGTGRQVFHSAQGKEKSSGMDYGKKWRYGVRMALYVFMFLLGFYRFQQEEEFRAAYLPGLKDGMQLSVQGRLSSKEYKNNQYIYTLTSCAAGIVQEKNSVKTPVFCNRILVYSNSDDASIGEILVLNGTVELWRNAVNEGNFDEESFYESKKIDFKMKDIHIIAVHGKKCSWKEALYRLRMHLKEVYVSVMEEDDGGVMATMVLGDQSLLDGEIKELYRKAGISHILSISGLHISVIGMTLYSLLRKLGIGFAGAGIAAGLLMEAYGTMVGMGTSVQRAVLMFLLMTAAQAVARSYDSLNSLAFAALVLLLDSPGLIFYAGFLFSFAAVTGVVWIGQTGQSRYKRKESGKGGIRILWEKLRPGITIQLSTLPFAAWYYYEIPVYAVFINLIVLPVMGLVLFAGVAGGFVGLLSLKAARLILFPCHVVLSAYRQLCAGCAGLPCSMWITGRPQLWKMVIYYIVLVFLTWNCRRRARKLVGETGAERRGSILIPAGMLALIFLFLSPQGGFELDVLDVGQGDACYLQTQDGFRLFVDGGSTDVKKVGEYRILPFLKFKGIRQIDYWTVSHTDSDHISGLIEILESGYPIRYLVFSKDIVRDEAYEGLLILAKDRGTDILQMEAGDVLHLENASVTALFPEKGRGGEEKNAASLVLYYEESDFTGIFTGDIGAAEEKRLTGLFNEEGVDFYKAAHHGSKHSNSREFLKKLHPLIATVSCGLKNNYGHPGAEAVCHMQEAGSTVFYTMYAGQVRITVKKGCLFVQKYLDPLDVTCIPVVE